MAKTNQTKKITAPKATAGKTKTVTTTKAKAPAKAAPKAAASKVAKPVKRAPAASDIIRPTRNKTAYMMFVKEQRKKTQDANPEMNFVDVTRDIATRWGNLTPAQLKTYEDQAAKDKIRYEKEVTEFRANHPDEPLTVKKQKRAAKLKGPTKARSAYVFYTIERRAAVHAANPDMEFGEVTKTIANEWNNMNESQKAKYEKQSEEDRVRYESESDAFNREHPEVKRRKLKAKKDAPKKARSAYLFYTMEKRNEFKNANPNKTFGDLTKLVADDWKKLNASQKKKFEKLAEEDRKRYDNEMANYVRPTDDELDAQIASDPRRKKKAKTDGPKRPRSAYLFYTTSERTKYSKDHPNMKFGDVTRDIAVAWKGLSGKEKSKFEEMAKADQIRYQKEIAAAK